MCGRCGCDDGMTNRMEGIYMGLLDKITTKTISKTTNRMADKISDGIVNGLFGKKKSNSNDYYDSQVDASTGDSGSMTNAERDAVASRVAASVDVTGLNEGISSLMGAAYNTKKCPECNSVCVNSPVTCPYCGADLKSIKPLTPDEIAALQQ